jgi:hypothetical protein
VKYTKCNIWIIFAYHFTHKYFNISDYGFLTHNHLPFSCTTWTIVQAIVTFTHMSEEVFVQLFIQIQVYLQSKHCIWLLRLTSFFWPVMPSTLPDSWNVPSLLEQYFTIGLNFWPIRSLGNGFCLLLVLRQGLDVEPRLGQTWDPPVSAFQVLGL